MAVYDCRRNGTVMFSELLGGGPRGAYAECESNCNADPRCAKYFVTRDEEDIRGNCFLFDDRRGTIAHELNRDPAAHERWCEKVPATRPVKPVPRPPAVSKPPPPAAAPLPPDYPPSRERSSWRTIAALVAVGFVALVIVLVILRRFFS